MKSRPRISSTARIEAVMASRSRFRAPSAPRSSASATAQALTSASPNSIRSSEPCRLQQHLEGRLHVEVDQSHDPRRILGRGQHRIAQGREYLISAGHQRHSGPLGVGLRQLQHGRDRLHEHGVPAGHASSSPARPTSPLGWIYRTSSNRGQAPTIGRWSISPDRGTRRGRSFDGVGGIPKVAPERSRARWRIRPAAQHRDRGRRDPPFRPPSTKAPGLPRPRHIVIRWIV